MRLPSTAENLRTLINRRKDVELQMLDQPENVDLNRELLVTEARIEATKRAMQVQTSQNN